MGKITFYRCEKCGNIVALVSAGGGTLTCCGQAMTEIKANSTDAAQEKHVPVVAREGGKIRVTVGSVLHPMTEEHYIMWIALESEGRITITKLAPGTEPKADFEDVPGGTVYAYCNLHGLWKANI